MKKKKILWVCPYSLLDVSNGASISIKTMLEQLNSSGFEVVILSASIFSSSAGSIRIKNKIDFIKKSGSLIQINTNGLGHNTYITKSLNRLDMTAKEENDFFTHYLTILDDFKPDLVWFYGGLVLEMLLANEAKYRKIKVAFYLVNAGYYGNRWHKDIDYFFTDTIATADLYKKRLGINPICIKTHVNKNIIAKEEKRNNVLFINPSLSKGVGIFIQVAFDFLDNNIPIIFEVVNSNNNWNMVLSYFCKILNRKAEELTNIKVTSVTENMSEVFSRAKLLFAPSLYWESGSRVIIEAMLNGIPVIASNSGGNKEILGDSGIILNDITEINEKYYDSIVDKEKLLKIKNIILDLYSNNNKYNQLSQEIKEEGQIKHDITVNNKFLCEIINNLLIKGLIK